MTTTVGRKPLVGVQQSQEEQWFRHARGATPSGLHLTLLWVHRWLGLTLGLIFTGLKPGGLCNMGFAGVLVAPSTGAVLGVFDVDRSPAYAPLFFHRDLWAGESGRILSGVMAVATLLSLSIGLYLWWPPRKYLLRRLSPRPWRATLSNAVRLHDRTGIWMLGGIAGAGHKRAVSRAARMGGAGARRAPRRARGRIRTCGCLRRADSF